MFLLFWRSRVLGLFGVCLVLFCLFVVVVVVFFLGGSEEKQGNIYYLFYSVLSKLC